MFKKIFVLCCSLSVLQVYAVDPNDLAKLEKMMNTSKNKGLDLSHADLRSYEFVDGQIDLRRANLSHADLSGVNLENMNLSKADLSHANLSNANLTGAN